ncbi:STAS domain-containing protein [Streptomyces sp. NRRL S-1022]|uniref:STAS domain-containing protein n=1 Tax=Streptomyces sp. NRRL S-1022 TaxID=1463880 RepID=UPI00099DD205|nr:STAS domain-containing protein [Streptomyces sp. NRRL S-1022]
METGQPSPARVRPGGPAPLLLQTVHEHRAGIGGISVLKARGTVDAANARRFSEAVAEHVVLADQAGEHPLLDLSEVYLACADAVRSLDRGTGPLARSGRALPVVQPRPHVREALTAAGLPGIRVHASLAGALDGLNGRPGLDRLDGLDAPPAGRPAGGPG